MSIVAEFWQSFNSRAVNETGEKAGAAGTFSGDVRFNEPMVKHTTFKVGGPADLWLRPAAEDWNSGRAAALLEASRREGVPLFILGGGANLVVSDSGIRGIVVDMTGYAGRAESDFTFWGNETYIHQTETRRKGGLSLLWFRSGTSLDDAAEEAARLNLSGLEFLAGMPGSVGGALWMNARCYDREMADVTAAAAVLDRDAVKKGPAAIVPLTKEDFGYKTSPFQGKKIIILSAAFDMEEGDSASITKKMEAHRKDRETKGHYRFPSAGSAFKNNRNFEKPTGKIIDELGLKGFSMGDAQVAPWHGNIIINRGQARAADIRALMEEIRRRVKEARGLELESEIIFAGDWSRPA